MAKTSNSVQLSAALSCSVLSAPSIGMSTQAQMAFTDGDTASDTYIACAPTTGTALNADLAGSGFILVKNPELDSNGAASTVDITLKISSTVIGTLPPGGCALLPIDTGVIVTGISSSGTINVGVTIIECDAND